MRTSNFMMNMIRYYKKPNLNHPILIAGFGGLTNAADVASLTTSYLIKKLNAQIFAEMRPDIFYNFGSNRPVTKISGGQISSISLPSGKFHFFKQNNNGMDLIVFWGAEPHLRWQTYAREFMKFMKEFNVSIIITVASLYDQVLHYEEKVSAIVSDVNSMNIARKLKLSLLDRTVQIGMNTLLIHKAKLCGLTGLGLWAHAPFYIHGENYKLCSRIVHIICKFAGLTVDTSDLDNAWVSLEKQIDELIEKNEELREQINKFSTKTEYQTGDEGKSFTGSKIIHMEDFFKKKDKDDS